MTWQDVRTHYPHQWLLIEALKAHTKQNKRIIENIAIINTYPDSVNALKGYTKRHREAPERELYVFHTDREELGITERKWLGIRGLR